MGTPVTWAAAGAAACELHPALRGLREAGTSYLREAASPEQSPWDLAGRLRVQKGGTRVLICDCCQQPPETTATKTFSAEELGGFTPGRVLWSCC